MVTEGGQLYTIEGIAAGLIMIMTAYLVVGATSIYTPGDAHISDMQLEVLGSDALKMMDITPNYTQPMKSPLQQIIETENKERFRTLFLNFTNSSVTGPKRAIHFSANYSYRVPSENTIRSDFLDASRNLTGGEHAVRVTKWVIVNKKLPPDTGIAQDHAVLVEVLLWRD